MEWEVNKWDRNVSLVLAVFLLVGGGVGAYFYLSDTPSMGPRTPAEKMAAEKWIRVLLTIIWVGFSIASVVLMILVSAVTVKTAKILAKRNPSLKKSHGLSSTHDSTKVEP